MERLSERVKTAEKALVTFEEVMLIHNPSLIERDASIQRFEFTFEAIWKTAKDFLFKMEGIDVGSPKSVIRACREVGLFNDAQTIDALQMTNDRNLTVHTYNETLAVAIYSRLPDYVLLMRYWLEGIKSSFQNREGAF
jgi:nucleotidyltransferase substrate binding protein (TIGR01987 family)